MSIQSEITRIETAKSDIASAIGAKGVTVPTGTKLDGMAALIDSIESGGGGDRISINMTNDSNATIVVHSSAGDSKTIERLGGTTYFDNLSDGSSLTISSAKYTDPTYYFVENGYTPFYEFENGEFVPEVQQCTSNFVSMLGEICLSYGYPAPNRIGLYFDPSNGTPAIIIW